MSFSAEAERSPHGEVGENDAVRQGYTGTFI